MPHIKSFVHYWWFTSHTLGEAVLDKEEPGDDMCAKGGRRGWVPAPTAVKPRQRDTALEGLPEALQPKSLGEAASLVLFSVHHRRDRLRVLHNDSHFTVTLSQHASVVDVGRAYHGKQWHRTVFSAKQTLLFALPTQFFLAKKTLILFRLSRDAEFWEGEAHPNPGLSLDQSKPAMVFVIFTHDWLRNGHLTSW